MLLSGPFCFEPSAPYEVTMRLQRAGVTQRHPGAFILIDSVRGVPLCLVPGACLAGVRSWAGMGNHRLEWEVAPLWGCTLDGDGDEMG